MADRRTLAAALLALAPFAPFAPFASAASAQDPILLFREPEAQLGYDSRAPMQALGDVDGDGVPDLAVGYPEDAGPGGVESVGSVRVYSGRDGRRLWSAFGVARGDSYGKSLGVVGDRDGDGVGELLVGAPGRDGALVDEGAVDVLSGVTGARILRLSGSESGAQFGRAVEGVGDQDGDGVDEVAVGAPTASLTGTWRGRVEVFSGASGQLFAALDGGQDGDQFGFTIELLGDADADGIPDFLVGSPRASYSEFYAGRITLVSGATGAAIRAHDGTESAALLGIRIATLGDVDGDAVEDYAYSVPTKGPQNGGRVTTRSGATGAVLWTAKGPPNTNLGETLSSVDFDGDGVRDVIATTAPGLGAGAACVFAGPDGALLFERDGPWAGTFAQARVEGLGDGNADGFGDFAVRLWQEFLPGSHATVYLLSGRGAIGAAYCGPAQPNSTGQAAALSALGTPDETVDDLVLVAEGLPAGRAAFALASRTQGFVAGAGGSQGDLCLGGPVRRLGEVVGVSDAAGVVESTVPLGLVPVVAGETWNFQVWYRDVNPQPTSNFTDGLTITFR